MVSQLSRKLYYTKSGSPHHSSTRRSGFKPGSSGQKRAENEEYTKGDDCFSLGKGLPPHKENVYEVVCENQEDQVI